MIAKSQNDYSTKKLNKSLLTEIQRSLKNIKGYGSVEIYIQDYKVTQITERNIKKTTNGQVQNNLRS